MSEPEMEAGFFNVSLDQETVQAAQMCSTAVQELEPTKRAMALLVAIFIEAQVAAGSGPTGGSANAMVRFMEDASIWITSYLFPEAARKALGK